MYWPYAEISLLEVAYTLSKLLAFLKLVSFISGSYLATFDGYHVSSSLELFVYPQTQIKKKKEQENSGERERKK